MTGGVLMLFCWGVGVGFFPWLEFWVGFLMQ